MNEKACQKQEFRKLANNTYNQSVIKRYALADLAKIFPEHKKELFNDFAKDAYNQSDIKRYALSDLAKIFPEQHNDLVIHFAQDLFDADPDARTLDYLAGIFPKHRHLFDVELNETGSINAELGKNITQILMASRPGRGSLFLRRKTSPRKVRRVLESCNFNFNASLS